MKNIVNLITLTVLLFASTINAQTKNFLDRPYVETFAVADTLVTPDRIYLSIIIKEKDSKGRKSLESQENDMLSKLKSIGIDTEKQLTLGDLSSNFKKYFLRKTDIQKSKQFKLLVYDGETVGKVMLGLESIGISNIDLDKVEHSKIKQLKDTIRIKAVKNAKRKANDMVTALDQRLGKVLYVSEQSDISRLLDGKAPGVRLYHESYKKEYDRPISVDFEKIKIETQVNLKLEVL